MESTLNSVTGALNGDGGTFLDLLSFDLFAKEFDALEANSAWPSCPFHGPYNVAENIEPLCHCEICERRW